MADVAKRLVGPSALTTGSTVLYTVPASTTTIVRSIHVMNVSTSVAVNFSLGINSAPSVTSALFSAFGIAANGALDWSGFLVLNASDTLTAFASTASALTLVISGVEVS